MSARSAWFLSCVPDFDGDPLTELDTVDAVDEARRGLGTVGRRDAVEPAPEPPDPEGWSGPCAGA